jgi:hypothetical protein
MESERHLFFSEESRQQFDKGFDKGRAAEKAADVLIFLEARGLAVSDAQRARIVGTNDMELLGRWVRRAATVSAVEDLFE